MEIYNKVLEQMDGTEEILNGEQCSKISMMDGEIAENIYLLIFHHYVINNKINKTNILEGKEIPYKGKFASKDEKGAKFLLSSLPTELQKVIVRYLKMISK